MSQFETDRKFSQIVPTAKWQPKIYNDTSPGHRVTGLETGHQPHLRTKISSKYTVSILITFAIVIAQIFIAFYYIRGDLSDGIWLTEDQQKYLNREWACSSLSHLGHIHTLADKFGVKLIIVDGDLLDLLSSDFDRYAAHYDFRRVDQSHTHRPARSRQESSQKSIIHIAIVNETSGGQPSIRSFHKALKDGGYTMIQHEETGDVMPSEVYKRPADQFDDINPDEMSPVGRWAGQRDHVDEISKIYTEFLAHIFIVNNSVRQFQGSATSECSSKTSTKESRYNLSKFIVIHLFVLYDFDSARDHYWIQPSLQLSENEKHKLISYGVHMIDFLVPLNFNYLHMKRSTILLKTSYSASEQAGVRKLDGFHVFDRPIEYNNNSYIHCQKSQFNITGLIDDFRRTSNYVTLVDQAEPLRPSSFRENIDAQLAVALRFLDVFAKAYGNFQFWLTGSSLVAYHKHCDLSVISRLNSGKSLKVSAEIENIEDPDYVEPKLDKVFVDVEIGILSNEMNESMLADLSNARMIGITMLTDWRKQKSIVRFRVSDCPNIMFNIYIHELRNDSSLTQYVTRNLMTMTHKLVKRKKLKDEVPVKGHVSLGVEDLKFCWTKINELPLFRVPCNTHDHLKRIYVI